MDFEKSLKELEGIAEKMSSGEMGLAKAVETFKRGMELVRALPQRAGSGRAGCGEADKNQGGRNP